MGDVTDEKAIILEEVVMEDAHGETISGFMSSLFGASRDPPKLLQVSPL
jgi:hypothetical protein